MHSIIVAISVMAAVAAGAVVLFSLCSGSKLLPDYLTPGVPRRGDPKAAGPLSDQATKAFSSPARLVANDSLADDGGGPASDRTCLEPGKRGGRSKGQLLTQRHLQVVLGLLWLLDAVLQFQPYMFTQGFVTDVLAMNAMYQPQPIGELIIVVTRTLLPHAAAWNALFASIQLGIAVGLLWRRTVRVALAVSFAWGLGVWAIGEGFGGLLTGTATLVGGAPGAVLLYGLVGLILWPRARPRPVGTSVAASSVAAEGPLGDRGGRIAWATLWCGGALLQILPAPYPPSAVLANTITMNLPEPGFLAGLDRTVVGIVERAGNPLELLIAACELLIGIHVFSGGRWVRPLLWAGVAVSLVFWMLGQNFGGIFAGAATDLNSGPLFVLLAATLYPRRASANGPQQRVERVPHGTQPPRTEEVRS